MKLSDSINWADDWHNVTFKDSVRIVGFARGRSAANLDAKSTSKEEYFTIFLVDFFDMLENGDIVDMTITGTFEIKKRGRDLGIRLKDTPKRTHHKIDYSNYSRPVPRYI